jgi:hypothetical protein
MQLNKLVKNKEKMLGEKIVLGGRIVRGQKNWARFEDATGWIPIHSKTLNLKQWIGKRIKIRGVLKELTKPNREKDICFFVEEIENDTER